jgi:carbonic anhydrase
LFDLTYRYNPFAPVKVRQIETPADAIRELEEGNRVYKRVVDHVRGMFRGSGTGDPLVLPFDPMTFGVAMIDGTAVAQEPFALVLGCSDARVPTELVFHQDSNDLFVVRVAGNVLGIECLGSIDFAVDRMKSLRLLTVLGHTNCGAVTSAVDMYLGPTEYPDLGLSFALRSLVDRVMIAVRGAASALDRAFGPGVSHDHPGYRTALIEAAVFLNAALTARDLRNAVGSLPEKGVEVVYGVFDLATQRVRSRPEESDDVPCFSPPPADAAAFEAFVAGLAQAVIARGGIDLASA